MAFQLSPGVLVQETDVTAIVPAVATSIGGTVGYYLWGPCNEIVTVSNEQELVARFGKPNNSTSGGFLTAASFLAYGSALKVVRASSSGLKNATSLQTKGVASIAVDVAGTGYTAATVAISAPDDPDGTQATATATTDGDAVTGFTVTEAGSGYSSAPTVTISGDGSNATATATLESSSAGVLIKNEDDYIENYASGTVVGMFAAKYPGTLGNSLKVSMADSSTFSSWAYASEFDYAPTVTSWGSSQGVTQDEVHIIVIDEDGDITGSAGTILEKFVGASKAGNAKDGFGSSNYYKDVLNQRSQYVWHTGHPVGHLNWGNTGTNGTAYILASAVTDPNELTSSLAGGALGTTSDGDLQTGWDLFANDELVDVNLLVTGNVSSTVAKYVVDNVADVRKDCIAFISPTFSNVIDNTGSEATDISTEYDTHTSSSYAVMDSGWKYMYDRYHDKYRWIPLNGDVAGLCARTDDIADPWYSPAGYNRGQIKNAVKLAYSPNKTDRDTLYKKGVNPVVGFPGAGIVLFGDKTMVGKASAFDRINVRRLFITLEKAISTAAKFQLFEFNDAFTRAQFRNLVEPFLRDVQGRRGIYDFRVVCDETNNTGQVIDSNSFVADIFIKPAKSINYITLNFVATRTGISFEEIGI
jgi:hypothetical protein